MRTATVLTHKWEFHKSQHAFHYESVLAVYQIEIFDIENSGELALNH